MKAYSKTHVGKYGLCLDWETSGSTWGGDSTKDYQGLSYGAIIYDTVTFEPVETLYRELHFDASKYKWSKEAEAVHGLSQAHLAANGVTREEGLVDLLDLISRYIGPTNKVCMLGHNAVFDIAFTDQLARDFGLEIQWHHVLLDTSALGFLTVGMYKSDDLFNLFCDVKRGEHNALDDALMTLAVARGIKQVFLEVMGDPVTS